MTLKEILECEEFVTLCDGIKERLTKKVMAHSTPPETRDALLAEYHALNRVLAEMRTEAAKRQ